MDYDNETKPLHTGWSLWEHQRNTSNNYDKNSCCIGSFFNVEDFWRYYNNYPKPSEIFFDGKCKPTLSNPDREVAAISLFRKDIEPKWEDVKNRNGGEIAVRKFKNVEELDKLWELLSVWCISEKIVNSKYITGIRAVDSSIPPNRRILHRVEVWFSDISLKPPLEKSFREILNIDPLNQTYYKEHSTAVESTKKNLKIK